MYHSTRPADWTDQQWIDWLHEEVSTILDKLDSAERSANPGNDAADYAAYMSDPSARAEDYHRQREDIAQAAAQFLDRTRLELTRFNLDHVEFFRELHNATPAVPPLEIRTDLPPDEVAAQMIRIGEHFRALLDPLALNSLYVNTDFGLDDAECPDCYADAFRKKGTADDFQCAGCYRRFPYSERSTRQSGV